MAKSTTTTIYQLLQILESANLNQKFKDIQWSENAIIPYVEATGAQITDGSADIGRVANPAGDFYIAENRTIKIVRIGTPNTVIGEIGLTAAGGIYTKITKSYTDFATAGLINTIDLFTLPAKTQVSNTFIKHDTQFLGGGITAYKIGCGILGDLNKLSYDFDVFQAVAKDTAAHHTYFGCLDFADPTVLKVTAQSVGANLDQATQGVVQIQLDLKVLV
jgi:hypothetical protein